MTRHIWLDTCALMDVLQAIGQPGGRIEIYNRFLTLLNDEEVTLMASEASRRELVHIVSTRIADMKSGFLNTQSSFDHYVHVMGVVAPPVPVTPFPFSWTDLEEVIEETHQLLLTRVIYQRHPPEVFMAGFVRSQDGKAPARRGAKGTEIADCVIWEHFLHHVRQQVLPSATRFFFVTSNTDDFWNRRQPQGELGQEIYALRTQGWQVQMFKDLSELP